MTEQEKAVEVLENLKRSGKHLAFKLSEVYKATGIKNIHECQAADKYK